MLKYLIPITLFTQVASAEPIQTEVNASFHKLVHVALHANAAGTDKPAVLIFDRSLPRTEQNQGIATGLQASDLSPETLQTEGPIQILYQDFEARKLLPCGEGISQHQGGEQLIRIKIDMKHSPDGVSCFASGEYLQAEEGQEKDDSSHVAHLKEVK